MLTISRKTPSSKLIVIVLFFLLPLISFILGALYKSSLYQLNNQSPTSCETPSCKEKELYSNYCDIVKRDVDKLLNAVSKDLTIQRSACGIDKPTFNPTLRLLGYYILSRKVTISDARKIENVAPGLGYAVLPLKGAMSPVDNTGFYLKLSPRENDVYFEIRGNYEGYDITAESAANPEQITKSKSPTFRSKENPRP